MAQLIGAGTGSKFWKSISHFWIINFTPPLNFVNKIITLHLFELRKNKFLFFIIEKYIKIVNPF